MLGVWWWWWWWWWWWGSTTHKFQKVTCNDETENYIIDNRSSYILDVRMFTYAGSHDLRNTLWDETRDSATDANSLS